jgi:biopolymer transport protein ExbB
MAHFLAQTDAIGRIVLLVLLLMSLASWYVIATRAAAFLLERRRSGHFLGDFCMAPSNATLAYSLKDGGRDEPFSRLALRALAARRNPGGDDFEHLTRAIARAIGDERARIESGLTLLASVGSTAPFVGLFGTVWAVYHALVSIGASGQGTLDKVAGPVGEALIMTALGLAVAVPAVLAYNAFVRANRLVLARLEGFAHDVLGALGAHPQG